VQGPTGEIGARGPVGVLDRWTSYREFWFETNEAGLHNADRAMVSQIATYLRDNPSLQIGVDGSLDSRNTNSGDRNLGQQRVKSICDALVAAGVPANRIKTGAFGDPQLRRDQRVELLLVTVN
jgi:outer membrane protein OmpA-like peptidoglycan-associated protein